MSASIVIAVCGFVLSLIVFFMNTMRDKSADAKSTQSEMTTVIVKLEAISEGIGEIKSDIRNVKTEMQEVRERLLIVEQSCKSAHKRIDTIQGIPVKEEG